MRIIVEIDDELMAAAQEISGIEKKDVLLCAGLNALIEKESAYRLAKLVGSEPQLSGVSRHRAKNS